MRCIELYRQLLALRYIALLMCALMRCAGVVFGQSADSVVVVPLPPQAQSKTVEVSRVYDPTIQDADKINFLPTIDDTVELAPHFSYSLYARPVMQNFPLRPVPPARMGKEGLEELSYYYLKLGMGNYFSPLAEGYISGGRSDRFTFGVGLRHRSAFGKLKLRDGEKVKAPYSSSVVHLFCDGLVSDVALHADLYYRHRLDAFYGHLDTLYRAKNLYEGTRVGASIFGANFGFNSTHIDSLHFQYAGRVGFEGYADTRDMGQSHLVGEFSGHKYFKRECFGGTARLDYYHKRLLPEVDGNILASLAPWVRLFGDRWRVQAGVDLMYERNAGKDFFHVFPQGHISYDIVRNYFIPYIEVDGRVERADYLTLREENAWVLPGLHVWNAERKMELRGGVKGNFNPRWSYNIYGTFALVDSAHFFVNQEYGELVKGHYESLTLLSPFVVEYDNVQELHAVGELGCTLGNRFSFALRGDYWYYKMKDLAVPWHRPLYSGLFRASYNLRQKVYVSLDFYLAGGIRARGVGGSEVKLKPITDLNFDVRYQLSSTFSLFVDLRNILALPRERYYLYPLHRFNGHAGIILNF